MTGYGRPSALASYGRIANAEMNPLQQIVMLYDGAMKFLRLTADDIESGDMTAKAEHVGRALDIIGYLQSILDFDRGGEVAPVLDYLYNTITWSVLKASASLDVGEMRRAADLLSPVRDSWMTIAAAPPSTQETSAEAPIIPQFVGQSAAVSSLQKTF